MLVLMADIHSEAEQPCSALPYALSAWLHATELGMDLKVRSAGPANPMHPLCCLNFLDCAKQLVSEPSSPGCQRLFFPVSRSETIECRILLPHFLLRHGTVAS